jgi:hypothetical protein
VLAVAVLILATSALGVRVLGVSRPPEEDAAMLLRYALHLSQGHGITWNMGERPVDGATDFLYLMAVGAAARHGITVEEAAHGIGFALHLANVILVYVAIRRLHRGARSLALAAAAYLAAGPGLFYVAAGFGTTVFTLTVTLAWCAASRLASAAHDEVAVRAAQLGLAGVVMGMARPEGALLTLFLLLAVLMGREHVDGDVPRILVAFAITFGLLGGAYFVWHWVYFGHALPNPFARRGGGIIHSEVLGHALRNVVGVGGPALAIVLAGLAFRGTRRVAALCAVPVALFAFVWILMSDEANYFMRYRYPVLPILLIGAVPVAQMLAASMRARPFGRALVPVAFAVLAVVAALTDFRLDRMFPAKSRVGLYDVGTRLGALHAGYTLVTTEAGLLPFYSNWTSVDAWGLNDSWIAHHGGVTAEYLDRYHPDVIMFHAYMTPEARNHESGRGLGPEWGRMTHTLERYAEEHGYRLVAVYQKNKIESHYYYVRRGLLDEASIVAAIHIPDYEWDGRPAQDATPPS